MGFKVMDGNQILAENVEGGAVNFSAVNKQAIKLLFMRVNADGTLERFVIPTGSLFGLQIDAESKVKLV